MEQAKITPRMEICDNTVSVLIFNDKYRIYAMSKADMLKSLLRKRSQNDTFQFTRDILANSEIARISSIKKISFSLYTAP